MEILMQHKKATAIVIAVLTQAPRALAQTIQPSVNVTLVVTDSMPVPGWSISAAVVIVGLIAYYVLCRAKRKR